MTQSYRREVIRYLILCSCWTPPAAHILRQCWIHVLDQGNVVSLEHYPAHRLPVLALRVILLCVVQHQVHVLVEAHDVTWEGGVKGLVAEMKSRARNSKLPSIRRFMFSYNHTCTRLRFCRYLKIRLMGCTITFCTLAFPLNDMVCCSTGGIRFLT